MKNDNTYRLSVLADYIIDPFLVKSISISLNNNRNYHDIDKYNFFKLR